MYFDQKEFNEFTLNNKVPGLFPKPKELASKRISHWYFNWRDITNDAFLLDILMKYIIEFSKDLGIKIDCFYGVPEGATKLGIITQLEWARQSQNYTQGSHIIPMGRGSPKEHGDPKDRYFIGEPKGNTVIIEDVTTTGGSLLKTIGNLKELENCDIVYAIALTNRMEITPISEDDDKKIVKNFKENFRRATGKDYPGPMGVMEAVNMAEVPYAAMSDALQLLPQLFERLNPSKDITDAIVAEFEKYGVERLLL